MSPPTCAAVFIYEGSSDAALDGIVSRLLLERGVRIRMTSPDFARLQGRVGKDLTSRLRAALVLMKSDSPPLVVMHRDTDTTDIAARQAEMESAMADCGHTGMLLPLVPVRMTEAWLLLDEAAIRRAAGNPSGRMPLDLPTAAEVERRADPKAILRQALLTASGERGRRQDRVARRFGAQRRQLLEQLDVHGPVTTLSAWQHMVDMVDAAAQALR